MRVLQTDQGVEELVVKRSAIYLRVYVDIVTKAFSASSKLKSSLCTSRLCPPGPCGSSAACVRGGGRLGRLQPPLPRVGGLVQARESAVYAQERWTKGVNFHHQRE